MKHCLWCGEYIQIEIKWSNVLSPPKGAPLCESCKEQLDYLPVETCKHCSRVTESTICADCEKWDKFYNGHDPLCQNISVFQYNSFLQEVITKWKYRGDFKLGDIFQSEMKSVYTRKLQSRLPKDTVVLSIPLSSERKFARAFNQAAQLASFLPVSHFEGITRTHNEKQSKKSRKERMLAINPFNLEESINKTVLLVDDIYTTGRTLRHAAELLKASGTPTVYSLTLVRV